MVGDYRAPGDGTTRAAYETVLLPGYLTQASFFGDCYTSGDFPVRLCFYQFITLLACAIPESGDRARLPVISMELLRLGMAHGKED